ncbi:MAG: hypothetical protein U0835_05040 [Isosphaeraceae bacterium]
MRAEGAEADPAARAGRVSRRLWLGAALGFGALVALPGAWLAWQSSRGTPEPPMPDPNGYDDLVAAGAMVQGQMPAQGDLRKAATEDLRSWVGSNADALARARVGLGRETRVRLPDELMPQSRMDALSGLRQLARLLTAEGEIASRDGKPAETARSVVDAFRLARGTAHGGVIIDHQVGSAVEMMTEQCLHRWLDTLPAAECRTLIAAVEDQARGRETVDTIFARDQAFTTSRSGWQQWVAGKLAARMVAGTMASLKTSMTLIERLHQAQRGILAATLALRLYRLDHPEAPVPAGLEALVPAYLPSVPADPFGKGPIKMKVEQGGKAFVYSVGPDGVDDNNTPIPPRAGFLPTVKGDITSPR